MFRNSSEDKMSKVAGDSSGKTGVKISKIKETTPFVNNIFTNTNTNTILTPGGSFKKQSTAYNLSKNYTDKFYKGKEGGSSLSNINTFSKSLNTQKSFINVKKGK